MPADTPPSSDHLVEPAGEGQAAKNHLTKSHLKWMMAALESARLALPVDVPVGAVILKDGQIVASAYNQRELSQDPLGHAELIALRQAARHLGRWRLDDCTLYVTLEPCPMCASAIAQARIPTIIFGAYDTLAGACGSKHALLMPGENGTAPQVWGGILEDPCRALLQEFFSERRMQESP